MANTYITRTPSSNGNQKIWTWSGWIKINGKSGDGTYQYLIEATYGNGNRYSYACVRHGTIEVYGGDYTTGGSSSMSFDVTTTRLLRDPSAWYHIVVAMDTTQSTSTDRLKIYINGVQETSFQGYVGSGASATFPAQDDVTFFNVTTTSNQIGKEFDGSMAHVHFVDGTAYPALTFGETDSTSGIWKPKTAPSVTYGTNGFFLKFENSGNLDLDSSGNNHTFATSGTLTQNVDTPSNNFSTLNPLDVSRNGSPFTKVFLNGNLTVTTTDYIAANGSLGASSGKFYWEFKLINSSASNVYAGGGVINFENWDGGGQGGSGANTYIYATSGQKANNGSGSSFGATLTAGDIVGVALDLDNGFLYFSKNGTWQNSGVPTSGASGTGNAFSSLSGTFAAHLSDPYDGQDHDFSINFGQGYFGTTVVASAGTSPSEGGIFEYDCPSGYQSLCTKGINSF